MNNFKRLRALFLCAMVSPIALANQACAAEFKVDLGVTQFTRESCGFWYQCDTPHTLRLTSPSVSLKVYTDKTADGWQIGGGFDEIGGATSDAMIYDCDDYGSSAHPICNGSKAPLSHMQGQGSIPALFLVARKSYGNWFIEGGVYLTRPRWETTNFDWYGGPNNTVGPIVSHLNHEIKNTYDLGGAVGYQINEHWGAILKAVPTHAINTQLDSTNPTGVSYFPGIYKAYSPTLAVEYTF
ncbi:MAG TPA: hypothetical protein VNW52_10580 [Burkholderiaceae bacterium]|jgi:hypothetical protein|nr:hypothetical protein [Burkholderiaceae bacterium]